MAKMVIMVTGESARMADDGKTEFVSITGTEVGEHPMEQFIEFGLAREDAGHKGKLVNKLVTVHVKTSGDVYQHKARFAGRILSVQPAGK